MNLPGDNPRLWNRNYLVIITATAFISISFHMIAPTFPIYMEGLTKDIGVVGILTSLFMVSAVLIRPTSGSLADRYDRRIVFDVGIGIVSLSILGYVIFKTIPAIIITRLFHGAGWGLATTASGALASDNIPPKRMAEGISYLGLSSVLANSVGPALGLEVLNRHSAEIVFMLAAGFALIGWLIFLLGYEKPVGTEKIVAAIKPAPPRGLSKWIAKEALLPASVIFFIGLVIGAISTFIALYAIELGITNIGFFFTIQAIATVFARPVIGRLADKKGYGLVVVPNMMMMIAALVAISIATGPVYFIIAAVLYGIGIGTITSMCQAMSLVNVNSERRGAANSTYFLGLDLGSGMGPILAGYSAKAIGYSGMYLSCTIPVVLGLALFVFGGGISLRPNKKLSATG